MIPYLYEYFREGGIIMVLIFVVSFIMWTLIFECLISLYGLKKLQGQNKEIIIKELLQLNKHIKTIFVLAAVAPLLGLLGTICGIMKTFEVLAYAGAGTAKLVASGISEALITTQVGLVVAIPGYFAATQLAKKTNLVKYQYDRYTTFS